MTKTHCVGAQFMLVDLMRLLFTPTGDVVEDIHSTAVSTVLQIVSSVDLHPVVETYKEALLFFNRNSEVECVDDEGIREMLKFMLVDLKHIGVVNRQVNIALREDQQDLSLYYQKVVWAPYIFAQDECCTDMSITPLNLTKIQKGSCLIRKAFDELNVKFDVVLICSDRL